MISKSSKKFSKEKKGNSNNKSKRAKSVREKESEKLNEDIEEYDSDSE
jgi:hypothetical protein